MGYLAFPPSALISGAAGTFVGSTDGSLLLTGGTTGQVPTWQADESIAWADGGGGASSVEELDEWADEELTLPGSLIVQQAGGVDGVDEVVISHDGTNAMVANQQAGGWLYITPMGPFSQSVRARLVGLGNNDSAEMEMTRGGASSGTTFRLQHLQGWMWFKSQGYASGEFDQTYGGYVFFETFGLGDLHLASDNAVKIHSGGVGDEFIVGSFDNDLTPGQLPFTIRDDAGVLRRVKIGADGTGPGGSGRAVYID